MWLVISTALSEQKDFSRSRVKDTMDTAEVAISWKWYDTHTFTSGYKSAAIIDLPNCYNSGNDIQSPEGLSPLAHLFKCDLKSYSCEPFEKISTDMSRRVVSRTQRLQSFLLAMLLNHWVMGYQCAQHHVHGVALWRNVNKCFCCMYRPTSGMLIWEMRDRFVNYS